MCCNLVALKGIMVVRIAITLVVSYLEESRDAKSSKSEKRQLMIFEAFTSIVPFTGARLCSQRLEHCMLVLWLLNKRKHRRFQHISYLQGITTYELHGYFLLIFIGHFFLFF